jgi:hypothetical protein
MNSIQSFFRQAVSFYVRSWLYLRISVVAYALLASGIPLFPQSAVAQKSQTAKLSVPVRAGGVLQTVVDSALAVATRWSRPGDSLTVSRRIGSKQRTPSELNQTLIEKEGIAIDVSNQVLINYQFRLGRGVFEEEITSIQYVYRPAGYGENVDLLFLDPTKKAWIRRLLRSESGMTSSVSVTRPFSHQLTFLYLLESTDAKIHRIGSEQASEEEKTLLIDRVRQAALRSR